MAVEYDIHASRYTPTDAGARVAPRFCYGHRDVTSIDSYTPPAPANGFPETQVIYHYAMQDIPVWAKSDAMRAAFPDMARKTSGTASDRATLAGTMTGSAGPRLGRSHAFLRLRTALPMVGTKFRGNYREHLREAQYASRGDHPMRSRPVRQDRAGYAAALSAFSFSAV